MLNLTRLHLGIAHESQFQGLGIRRVRMPLSFGTRSVIVVPAKAGTYIPEAVVIGPQHKRVYARLRRAMRGDDSI